MDSLGSRSSRICNLDVVECSEKAVVIINGPDSVCSDSE